MTSIRGFCFPAAVKIARLAFFRDVCLYNAAERVEVGPSVDTVPLLLLRIDSPLLGPGEGPETQMIRPPGREETLAVNCQASEELWKEQVGMLYISFVSSAAESRVILGRFAGSVLATVSLYKQCCHNALEPGYVASSHQNSISGLKTDWEERSQ